MPCTGTLRLRDPTGAHAALQCGAVTGQAGEEVHDRVDGGRLEQLRPLGLMGGRDALDEAVLRPGPAPQPSWDC